ncbi:MAG: (4Fe-4S)-binding protein [Oscillospiraceae bacterium]|nr:(4Fe-4S)-binding protein [Oscillospiraceae bacterium]
MLTSKLLKETLKEWGADLVGVGAIERWDTSPEENNPRAVMPDAKNVICIGFRVHRGSLRGMDEGTYFSSYTLTGFADLNSVIAPLIQRRAASLIEDYGYEAVTIMYHANRFGDGKYNSGRPALREDGSEKPRPDIVFDYRIAAVLCGLGQIGHNRLLLTPEFGPAQRIYFLVTNAPIEADEVHDKSICCSCMQCVRQCPAKALSREKYDDLQIKDVTNIHRSALDVEKCAIAHWGGCSQFTPDDILDYAKNIIDGTDTHTVDGNPKPSYAEITKYLEEKVTYTKCAHPFTYGPAVVCGKCVRTCLASLDRTGRLRKKVG